MPETFAPLEPVRLFTPGPCMVPPDVLVEMSKPQEHHRTKAFIEIARACHSGLQYIFQTRSTVMTLTGSGTASMEAAIVSLCPPGAPAVLCIDGGKFGERWGHVCAQVGIAHHVHKVEWGTAVTAAAVKQYLDAHPDCPAVILSHSETSTATACDLQAIAQVTRASAALLIVDGITSIGALPFAMDEWGVDCAVTGSQKSLMLPPGLSFVTMNDRALARAKQVRSPGLYLNLLEYHKGAADGDPPYTPNNQLIRGLAKVVSHFQSVTLPRVWNKTHCLAQAVRAAGEALGMPVFSRSPSDSVTALMVPTGVDEGKLRKVIRARFGIELAGGQDSLKGRVVRINHMGWVDAYDTAGMLACLELTLQELGHHVSPGAAVATAMPHLARADRP